MSLITFSLIITNPQPLRIHFFQNDFVHFINYFIILFSCNHLYLNYYDFISSPILNTPIDSYVPLFTSFYQFIPTNKSMKRKWNRYPHFLPIILGTFCFLVLLDFIHAVQFKILTALFGLQL